MKMVEIADRSQPSAARKKRRIQRVFGHRGFPLAAGKRHSTPRADPSAPPATPSREPPTNTHTHTPPGRRPGGECGEDTVPGKTGPDRASEASSGRIAAGWAAETRAWGRGPDSPWRGPGCFLTLSSRGRGGGEGGSKASAARGLLRGLGCGAFVAPPPERARGAQRRHVRICMRKGRSRGSARPGQDRSAPPPRPLAPCGPPPLPGPQSLRVPAAPTTPSPTPRPRPSLPDTADHLLGARAHLHDKARVYLARAPRRAFVPDQMTAQLLGRAPHSTLFRGSWSLPRPNVSHQRGALWGNGCTPGPALQRSGGLPGGGGAPDRAPARKGVGRGRVGLVSVSRRAPLRRG